MTLEADLERLDHERLELLALAESLAPAVLTARPPGGGWSVLEVVEHVAIAEREVLGGLVPPGDLVARPQRPVHRIRYWIVLFVLRSPIRVRVPSPTMAPAGTMDLPAIRRLWDENQAWVRDFATGLDPVRRREAMFRHPVCGPMTPAQTVRMGLVHLRTHRRQVGRILAAIGASGGPPA